MVMVLTSFEDAYFAAHPDEKQFPRSKWNTVDNLGSIHRQLVTFYNYTCGDYASAIKDIFDNDSPEPFQVSQIIGFRKCICLFVGAPVENFSEHAQELVISKHDANLNVSDYAILLYTSLHKDTIGDSFEGVPLSLLHEIFDPMADAKWDEWRGSYRLKNE
jgi:hypothetical protein